MRQKHPPTISQTEQLILDLLVGAGPMYGLELVTQSGGRLKRGTVYVTLGRMEDKGLVRAVEIRGDALPRRRYEPTAYGLRLRDAIGLMLRHLHPKEAR